jgi:succinate dehydrogenase/fumarate reductase flavoprotein subunit
VSARTFPVKSCDLLVVGGGGGGLLAALEASKNEALEILLVAKGPIGMSGLTPTANGGTAGAGPEEYLFNLMITTGRFLNDQELAWHMTHEIKNALEKLKALDVPVVPIRGRSVCVASGPFLQKLKRQLVRRRNITLMEDVLVTSLLSAEGTVSGATALRLETGEFFVIEAKAIVVATGGSAGELYPHTSNNPFGITTDASGTGHVMAYRAGAELFDMEMVQFVPLPANPRARYIRYFPEFWLGPYLNRFGDIVEGEVSHYAAASYAAELAQKLFFEMEKGNGPIYIDQRSSTAIDAELLIKSWEQRRQLIKSIGIDPRKNRIEIILGSHFIMGGVRVNRKTETTMPGLYATGEIMGSVHGACRLSGYSFSQMIVYGFEAGKEAGAFSISTGKTHPVQKDEVEREKEQIFRFMERKREALPVGTLKGRLKQVMERHAFVVRNRAGLTEALREIETIKADIPRIQVPAFKRFNLEWARAIEFPFIVDAAGIILRSALYREESRGCHYRADFRSEDNERWLCHTVARIGEKGPVISSIPVALTRMSPGAAHG